MNATNQSPPGRWKRKNPGPTSPDRSFGGFYRTSDSKLQGKDLRGFPLQTAEDAVVAAVRMGYGVVDTQINRGLDMARRLRGAADRAGVGDTKSVLDVTEDLLTRGALLGLEMIESATNQPGHPLRRLLTAELRMLGSLFGLRLEDRAAEAGGDRAKPEGGRRGAPVEERSPAAGRRAPRVRILHKKGSSKRAVTVDRLEIDVPIARGTTQHKLKFHLRVPPAAGQTFDADLTLNGNEPAVLAVVTTDTQTSGRWRAGICTESDGEQIGVIDISL